MYWTALLLLSAPAVYPNPLLGINTEPCSLETHTDPCNSLHHPAQNWDQEDLNKCSLPPPLSLPCYSLPWSPPFLSHSWTIILYCGFYCIGAGTVSLVPKISDGRSLSPKLLAQTQGRVMHKWCILQMNFNAHPNTATMMRVKLY